jgi:hypothetical protein
LLAVAAFIPTIATLLTMVEFGFGFDHALVDYQKGNADFAEYLHLALAQQSESAAILDV